MQNSRRCSQCDRLNLSCKDLYTNTGGNSRSEQTSIRAMPVDKCIWNHGRLGLSFANLHSQPLELPVADFETGSLGDSVNGNIFGGLVEGEIREVETKTAAASAAVSDKPTTGGAYF